MKKLIVALTLSALVLGPALQAADTQASPRDNPSACCASTSKTAGPTTGCCPAMTTQKEKGGCPMMSGCPVKQDLAKKGAKASTKKSKTAAKGSKDTTKQSKDLATK